MLRHFVTSQSPMVDSGSFLVLSCTISHCSESILSLVCAKEEMNEKKKVRSLNYQGNE